MGPVPQKHPGVTGWLILLALGGALLFALISHPIATLAILGVLVLIPFLTKPGRKKRVGAIRHERANEDIGSFARAFDRRGEPQVDPWAIRAVWDALTPLTAAGGQTIPLRPTDRWEADLGIDPEDIEDLVPQLVEQCERAPGDWKANPFYERLSTVGELVYFISAQPLRRSA